MELVVLSIHLLVCICLIGLVLLQRSEGGALGMGGGGGGALMSGRGAADALAKMTSVAGGFFIVTSLGLTLIAGAASTSGRSVMDLLPAQTAPATTAPATTEEPAAAPAESTTPDPTEGRGPSVNEFALGPSNAAASTQTSAPAPSAATTRAGPIDGRPTQTAAANQRQTTPASTTATPSRTTPARTQRTVPATIQTTPVTTSGNSVSGIDLTTDSQLGTESSDTDNEVAAVRRERAGPDQ